MTTDVLISYTTNIKGKENEDAICFRKGELWYDDVRHAYDAHSFVI